MRWDGRNNDKKWDERENEREEKYEMVDCKKWSQDPILNVIMIKWIIDY